MDPKRVGYVCPDGHRLFMWRSPFQRRLPEPKKVRALPASATDIQVLRYWLTDPAASYQLVDSLAMVCERLIEKLEGKAPIVVDAGERGFEIADIEKRCEIAQAMVDQWSMEGVVHRHVCFCPTCGQSLSRYGEPGYADGYICTAGHVTWHRGGRLSFTRNDANLELWLFESDRWLGRVADDALGRTESVRATWKPLVHPQLRATLARLRHHLP
jgi:hypothetical protein